MPDFLLEIGCEEIPDRMLDGAREELSRRVHDLLIRERLLPEAAQTAEEFSTPRRIAVRVSGLADRQADIEEQLTGPSTKVAFKDGAPTPAAHAFAKKAGIPIEKIERITTPKGEYIAATVRRTGRQAQEILSESLPKEIAGLYWAKNMYWRGKQHERFVRPVRWIVALLDDKVLPVSFGGVDSGRESQGHRILFSKPVTVSTQKYAEQMAAAFVVVQRAQREERIRKALDKETRTVPGARWREDSALLATVVNLTEYPSVILGSFEREYLTLPQEVLVTVMRDHQKYFAVEDEHGRLAPHFLAVLNTEGDPEGIIRHGNARVLRARFNDARFFWSTDQKTTLEQRVDLLKAVTFQKDLGSYYEKAERVKKLASFLAVKAREQMKAVDVSAVEHAARLAKTDLTAELVKEFTELQGIVGGLYAKAQELPQPVADAIYDQYRPASMEDAVPRTMEGALLSIADKADSIVGMFALGLQPSGSKDPFALRRQANGIVRILAEHGLKLSLDSIFVEARRLYAGSSAEAKFQKNTDSASAIAGFLRERIEFYLREALKIAYDEANAVLAAGFDDIPDVVARAQAVAAMRKSPDFEPISAAFKRMKNILRQASETGKTVAPKLQIEKLTQPEEIALAKSSEKAGAAVKTLAAKQHYQQALSTIAALRPQVDAFFDKVMVMVEDEGVRSNRLALLQSIVEDFSTIADFSEIVTAG